MNATLNKELENQSVEVINSEINPVSAETKCSEEKKYSILERSDLINSLKGLLKENNPLEIKNKVEAIKQSFYKKQKADIENQKLLFVENGGNENEFEPNRDQSEEIFKEILNEYKKQKAEENNRLEKEKEENFRLKQAVIEQLRVLTESSDDLSETIPAFRKLEQEWKNIGTVSSSKSNELWKSYSILQEKFYDLIKINNELREYDFKKNLEKKVTLCETAESLEKEKNIIAVSQKLQKLHEEWKTIGPVERNMREDIWKRFKEASSVINKKHQQYFEDRKNEESNNLLRKEHLCETIEKIDTSVLKTYKQWEEKSEEIIKWQEEWKQIGFAPRKENIKIYNRFRNACDSFFREKSQFYKETKDELNQNLERKKQLCEQAETLKDSTDWIDTTKKIIELQKEWKTIGQVSKKHSDNVWKQFITACDYFFEQKGKVFADKKTIESQNLALKKALIEKIKTLQLEKNREQNLTTLKELSNEWSKIGHIPFKEKDTVYTEFKTALDKHYDTLNVDAQNRKLNSFANNLTNKKSGDLNSDRRRLMHQYSALQNEIKTYENNLGFFASSKKADKLIAEMQRKIDKLKEESEIIVKKIEIIDQKS